MQRYYFTFGSKHVLPRTELFKGHELQGWSLGNHYVKIEAKDQSEARQVMFGIFGDKWSSCYTEETFQQMIKYNLKELVVIKPINSQTEETL